MFRAIARFSVKFRWLIIIFWLALVPILSSTLPKISDVSKNNNADFLPKHSAASEAINLEQAFQPKDTSDSSTIIVAREAGPLTDADNQAFDNLLKAVAKVDGVQGVQDKGTSRDGAARQATVSIGSKGVGPQSVTVAKDIRSTLTKALPSGVSAHLAGSFAEAIDADSSNSSGKDNTTLYTVIFILALLLFVFRSLLAPIVTLVPAALALTIAQPLVAKATDWGIEVSFITEILLIVLILGAGTDYGLFLVFRMREELRKGLDVKDAVVEALTKVGESITFSAATVAVALLSLLLASFGLYRGLGPALAIGLAVMLLVALTFLPAVLSVLGRAVFWPSKTTKREQRIGLWGRVADSVIQRPVLMIALGLILFGALSAGIVGYKTAGFNNGTAPPKSDSALGDAAIAKHFSKASTAPQLAIMHFNTSVWSSQRDLQRVQTAQQALAADPTFKAVGGPFNANGFSFTTEQLYQLHRTQPDSPILKAEAQFISPDGKTAQFFIAPAIAKAGSTKLASATPLQQAAIAKAGRAAGATQTALYSSDAISYDINRTANGDLKKIIPVVLIVIGLLLAIMLRSLVAPWYLIATVALSYVASLGFAMYLFVHLLGQDGLNFVVAFMLFIFSMALGEDYNILVMSRIREEAHYEPTLKRAVTKAIGITGTTVTSAGLILAGTFGVLGLVGGNTQIEQIGYSIAFGILLDTFFVRTLLVPSIVSLLGRWNWWPSKLSKVEQ